MNRAAKQVGPDGAAMANAVDESDLVARLREGDERAFESLVREQTPRLLAVTRRIVGREEDARDAVQDAFVSALKALGTFDGRSRLSTWLHRIAVNAALMKMRSRRRRPERDIDEFLPTFEADGHARRASHPWRSPGDDEEPQLAGLVRRMIDELPERHRLVLILRDVEGLDTAATAEVMGVSGNAVKILLHRARQALRERLDPHMRAGGA